MTYSNSMLIWGQTDTLQTEDKGKPVVYKDYYVFEGDTAEIPDKDILVHFYPDTRTILMQGKISGN